MNWTEKTLKGMSIEEKIGQMICTSSPDIDLLKNMTEKNQIGFVYLARQLTWTKTPAQVADLTNQLQGFAMIPVIFCADLECGLAQRFPQGVTAIPANMAVGATGDENTAYVCGQITAKEARAIGIHMPFSPVVDVNNNPDNPIINTRSFGEKPSLVSSFGVSYIRGCQENGGIATAKHFPGHGDTTMDTHLNMPVIAHSLERLKEVELPPFQSAVNAGVKTVMTSHIQFPALEPTSGLPATFSTNILYGLLRQEMRFEGLIVSDALAMKAIANNFGMEETTLKAVQAGIDILLVDDPEISFRALLDKLGKRQISEERIDISVRKILRLKFEIGLNQKRMVDTANVEQVVGNQKNKQSAMEIARQAVTLVKNDRLLPLMPEAIKRVLLVSTEERQDSVPDTNGMLEIAFSRSDGNEILEHEIRKRLGSFTSLRINENPSTQEMELVMKESRKAAVVVFASFINVRSYKPGSGTIGKRQVELVRGLGGKVPLLFIAFGSPYVITKFPQAMAIICSYGNESPLVKATVEVIFGEIKPAGKLPVTVSNEYLYGHGISF